MEKKTQQCSALLVTAPRVHGRRRDEDRCAVSPFIMLRQRMVCRAGLRCQQLTPHPTWHACVPAGRACPHGLDLHASQKLALDCAGVMTRSRGEDAVMHVTAGLLTANLEQPKMGAQDVSTDGLANYAAGVTGSGCEYLLASASGRRRTCA